MRNDEEEGEILKPVIREMIRTGYCREDVILLVDRITIIHLSSPEESYPVKAYRLFLTDREKTIQALFKRRVHKRISRREISEGSYIALKDYTLMYGQRSNNGGKVAYLAISDFAWAGGERYRERQNYQIDYQGVIERRREISFHYEDAVTPGDTNRNAIRDDVIGDGPDQNRKDEKPSATREQRLLESQETKFSVDQITKVAVPQSSDPKLDPVSEISSQNPVRGQSPKRESKEEKNTVDTILAPKRSQFKWSWAAKAVEATSQSQRTDSVSDLSTLASVTGPNRSRNRVVDVLAIVEYVEDFTVKRPKMPLKRDIRIIDDSTDKKVTFSNFVNPTELIPIVGDVVLLRNVVTHDYNGGNINAYPNQCEGKQWYIANPHSNEGCRLSLEETRLKIQIEGLPD